jgi:hypothetical protein
LGAIFHSLDSLFKKGFDYRDVIAFFKGIEQCWAGTYLIYLIIIGSGYLEKNSKSRTDSSWYLQNNQKKKTH